MANITRPKRPKVEGDAVSAAFKDIIEDSTALEAAATRAVEELLGIEDTISVVAIARIE